MKQPIKTVALLAVLGMAAVGCQKENIELPNQKCIGSGCCANEPGACELLEHGGMYCCTTCKCMSSQNGNCQKETFTMPEVVIISKAINFI